MDSSSKRHTLAIVSGCALLLAACAGDAAPSGSAELDLDTGAPQDGDGDREAAGDAPLDTAPLATEVCDGEPGVSLAAYFQPNYGQTPGAAVTVELGQGFLYVDGSCRFWVWQTHEVAAFRSGRLSATELDEMLSELAFDEWQNLDGVWHGGGADNPYQTFYSRTRAFVCQGGCWGAPAAMQQAYEAGIRWRGLLWEKGTPVLDTALRAAPYGEKAEDPTLPFGHTATPWPFDVPPADVPGWMARSREQGTSYLVEDPEVAAAIRAERDNAALRHPNMQGLWFGPHQGRYYGFGAREALPFEDERGLIPRPPAIADWESQ